MTPPNSGSTHELMQIEAEFRAGRISDAVSRAIAFLDGTADPVARANCAGILIDFGAALESEDVVTKGIDCLEALRVWYGSGCPAQVYYNLGNGWDALGRLKVRSFASADRWKCEAFQKAKACHREALRASSSVPDAKRTQYIVNYANLLSSMWRGLEAIKVYDQALALDSSFGMALCNKALAVKTFAGVSGTYRGAILAWAWQMLQRGLGDLRIDRVGVEGTRVRFKQQIAAIEAQVARSDILSTPLFHAPENLDGASGLERLYVSLCAREQLFLNVHVHENECEAATLDNVFIAPPVPVTDRFTRLARSLGQMIEDFSTARYLWVLAKSEDEDVARASRRTRTPPVPGIEAALRHGLTKASFRLGFDVLDKLADFINEYLGAGVSRQRVSFTGTDRHCLWWSRPKDRVLRPAIEGALRSSLAGLYDIFLDFQENAVTGKPHYQELKKMRNALTHRKLSVIPDAASGTEPEEEITPAELDDATRRVLFLARCAIMYLILFVDRRERKVSSW